VQTYRPAHLRNGSPAAASLRRIGRLAASPWIAVLMMALLVLGIGALILIGLEVDLLMHLRARTAVQNVLELEEILLLSTIIVGGLLVFSIRRIILQRKEIKRREAAESYALTLAFHDPLTGLPNRRALMDEIECALKEPPRGSNVHAVLLMDLNAFKAVNDIHGHPAGDELLIEVAGLLGSAAADDGLVARMGGDEFAAVARNLSGPEDAARLGSRLLAALNDPVRTKHGEHRLGLGIGIALAPRDGTDRAELVRKADVALYRAKAEGSSSLAFFEQSMESHLRERSFLEQELRAALSAEHITPRYQPTLDLETGRVLGFDVTPHWAHHALGPMTPDRYIPLAEDSGLIRRLTDQLLRRTCLDAAAWPDELTISFRLADAVMRDPGLPARIIGVLAETRMQPDRVEIAVSEGAVMRNLDESRRLLTPLREAGIRLALADFGTSYASIWHLRDLQFDKLKIDRSFIEDLDRNQSSAVVVRTILGLGQGLGVAISADGIARPNQRDMLLSQGLEEGQGQLFGEALSAEDAIRLANEMSVS
jgi:diguanylate cyclase (GGDEF)-like protein